MNIKRYLPYTIIIICFTASVFVGYYLVPWAVERHRELHQEWLSLAAGPYTSVNITMTLSMSNIRDGSKRYQTNNAECYAKSCHRRGKCIIAYTESHSKITSKTINIYGQE